VSDPEILTERLRMNRLETGDADAFFAYRSDPEVYRYQGWAPESPDEAIRFVEGQREIGFDTPGTWFQFAIRGRETGRLLGDLGVRFPEDDTRQVEIGFTIAPAHQRAGYGSEAVRGALDMLLGARGKHRVFASVDPRNTGSLALLERVGLRKEAHFRQSLRIRGEWVDDVVFAVLASEWNGGERGGGTS